MSIPRAFIDDLLNRADLVGLISRHVKLERSGNSYKGLCPFHEEKTPSFYVMPDKQFFHCFGCGVSGDAIAFLRQHDSLEFYTAVEELARMQGVDLPITVTNQDTSVTEKDVWNKRLALLQQASDYYRSMFKSHQFAGKAHAYLKQRGLNAKIAEKFDLGYAPPERNALYRLWKNDESKINIAQELGLIKTSDKGEFYDQFRNRIVFPIRDSRGRIRGFGGRVIDDEHKPKYLNSSESAMFHKSSLLYGLYESLDQSSKNAWLVVEGYLDVISLHQKGFKRVVACLGTAISQQQIQWLSRYNNTMCFAFDGDDSGIRAAEKTMHTCLSLASDEHEYRFAFLPHGEDPDSLVTKHGAQALERLVIKESMPLSDMFINWIKKQGNINTIEGKAKIASMALKELTKVPAGYFRKLLESQIHDMTYTSRYRNYSRKTKAPSVKVEKFTVSSENVLSDFITAVLNNPGTLTEGHPALIDQLRLLVPYAPDLPLAFFEKAAKATDDDLIMIMMEALPHDQITSIQKYNKTHHTMPGASDIDRLFTRVRKHYYDTMTSDQKNRYIHDISKMGMSV